ncbi:MAG: response regulator [Candidatus Omnitrophica bacterium]|nr:response regulator [Candidatus Omnitrophota bacterium]
MEVRKKILVIDDEIDLVQMVEFQFKAKGYEVQTASDGLAGLECVHLFKPDLIILDINMPRMGGIEFYSKICGPDGKPLYPVLVLTARANIQGLFQDLHIDGFMIKPFDIDRLVHEAGLIIKKRSQEASLPKAEFLRDTRRVCIVDQDKGIFDKLSGLFLDADYTVIPARSGAGALERMMKDVPDVALVHLGLTDIPGDTVVFRLSQMSKTMDVKFVLYTSKSVQHDRHVMERLSAKTGIWTFVEYNQLSELVSVVEQILKN